jgi:hypothetical protein
MKVTPRIGALVGAVAIAAFGAGMLVSSSHAGDHEAAGEMSPEQIMAKWMEYATPGEHHKMLAKAAGTWDVSNVMWEHPGADASEGKATSTITPILGGRYFIEEFEGVFDMGAGPMPFTGRNLMGYDNLRGRYFYVWIDSYSTGATMGFGTTDDGGKTVTYMTDHAPNPATGQFERMKSVGREISDDRHEMVFYKESPDGSWWKHMTMVYTRAR